ncbi:acyl transferase/acyl hydrolase/lysophospholipase, partial [Flagelloscypha sp. PMI_526]
MPKALPSKPRGLRLLSFDGGGLRAFSQAKIIQETLDRIAFDNVAESGVTRSKPRVADYFDLICGSGFGGLLAIMAGVLGMTGRELVDEFATLVQTVFSEDLNIEQRTACLEGEIKRIVLKYSSHEGGEDRRMISDASPCKVFVCATSPDNMSSPRLLRNYEVRANASPDCKVWEAAMATTALIGVFNLITVKTTHVNERFVGGEVRWNNPTHELTVEIANVFSGRDVACIVSIGSGHPRVLCLSRDQHDIFKRISEDCEQVANELFRRFVTVPDLYWRLGVEHGLQDVHSADVQELTTILASTHSYLQSSRPNNDVDALIEVLKVAKNRASVATVAGQLSAAAETMYLRDCPPPTPFFTGQKKHLTKLRVYFSNMTPRFHIAVLSGLGGSGKTQCGLMFIQQSLEENRFTEVFSLDASGRITLESGFKSVAEAKHVGKSFEDGIRYLEGRLDEWLLFLDNADDPELDLGQYIRRKHGNILITTRNPHVAELAPDCHCSVDRLDQADAKELLLRGVRVPKLVDCDVHATKIVEELGCLALAVNHTRAFLAKGTCALPDYLPLHKENRKELLRWKQSTDDYRYTVFTTWNISFNRLSEMAKRFLQIVCFMHHEAIPLFIFSRAWARLSELETDEREASVPKRLSDFLSSFTGGDLAWCEFHFLQLVEEVQSFSLIEYDAHKRTVSFHPLVQQWARK